MLEMRSITPEEFLPWLSAESRAHGNRLNHDPEVLRPHFDLDRSIAVFDQGQIVGGSHSHSLVISTPGSSAIVAGVSNVAVQPTHRRQGVMTQMMQHQIRDIHEREEPLAALFASESLIYGRFGYGVGSLYEQWSIPREHNSYAQPFRDNGNIAFVHPSNIPTVLPDISKRSTANRAGVVQKSMHHWQQEAQAPEHLEGGQGGLFYACYQTDERTEGYVIYRIRDRVLYVNELMATSKVAYRCLWRFCFDTDLVTRTEANKRPVDDALPWMLADPRRLQRNIRDGLWLRIIDVHSALKQRYYSKNDALVLEIKDELCPWNQASFRLEGSTEGATCYQSSESPDLTLPISALASTLLGAVTFSTLAQAGLIQEGKSGALKRADAMFEVEQQPWTPNNFG